MNSIFKSICCCSLFAFALIAPPSKEAASEDSSSTTGSFGKLTVTENLIRQEILRLDGDWESGSKPQLVGFLGEKFESQHFEMMTHLPTVEFFYVQDCKEVDNFAIRCLSTVISLRRLDFMHSEVDTTCMSLLSSNRELRELHFDDMHLTNGVMEGLTRLNQVETLTFDRVDLSDVTDEIIDRLSHMQSLKKCSFTDCRGISAERIKQLEAEFPDIKE